LKNYSTILRGPRAHNYDKAPELHVSKELEMYAYIVHAKSVPGIRTRHGPIDIVTIRESFEGEYSGIEHEVYPGVIESIKIITREKSMRIAKFAFDHAVKEGR
jgi:isocitrate dehydrogenase (NAD+)